VVSAPDALRIERGTRTGQPIIISLDSTEPGPALGGCRVKPYPSWRDGLDDALRLSAAMTDKAALAGLPYGGGKTVVALSPGTAAQYASACRSDLLADIGEAIDSLGGRYITGPDVGTSPDDMAVIARHTSHVLCRPQHAGGSGDSSAPTAAGTLACIDAVRDRVFGGRPASELTFAIQGLGHVGVLIADALARQGATLVVADTDPDRQRLASRWPARTADPARLLSSDADILVPAALGGILTPKTVPSLRCRAIVGPANNQLADDSVADLLYSRGITWAPDPVVSAGGIVAAVAREITHLPEPDVQSLLTAIGDRLGTLLDEAAKTRQTPLKVARQQARMRLTRIPGTLPHEVRGRYSASLSGMPREDRASRARYTAARGLPGAGRCTHVWLLRAGSARFTPLQCCAPRPYGGAAGHAAPGATFEIS
jgi:glutamate dehydrogenase/leucine dehydrogenase